MVDRGVGIREENLEIKILASYIIWDTTGKEREFSKKT